MVIILYQTIFVIEPFRCDAINSFWEKCNELCTRLCKNDTLIFESMLPCTSIPSTHELAPSLFSCDSRSELMVKKLRYYARFIVVCLLLRRMKLVRELIVELDRHIVDYTSTYEPDDQIEWSLVLDEIKAFITADSMVTVFHPDSNPIVISHRWA